MNEIQKARENFLIECGRYVGLPYIWGGGDTRVGLDCSGLAQVLLSKLNLDPPGDQTAHTLMTLFLDDNNEYTCDVLAPYYEEKSNRDVTPLDKADLGDIVFFGKNGQASHIAICLNSELMVEAGGGGSECTSAEVARKKNAQVRFAPISRRKDILCIIRPHGLPWSK